MRKSTISPKVLIIGAGASGLAAAYALKKANISVEVLEARSRIGGRVWTIKEEANNVPFELGAEFVHGRTPVMWELLKELKIDVREALQSVWVSYDDGFSSDKDLWDDIGDIVSQFEKYTTPDHSVHEVFKIIEHGGVSKYTIERAAFYVEGFNAADVAKISVASLVKAEQESPDANGSENYRLKAGYQALLEKLAASIDAIHLGTIVKKVTWKPDKVFVETTLGNFVADKLLITLPLGVLKANAEELGFVEFSPALDARHTWLERLEMGHALRATFQFNQEFLKQHVFNHAPFAHARQYFVSTPHEPWSGFWSAEIQDTIVWVAWVGGTKAEKLSSYDNEKLIESALDSLYRIFGVEKSILLENLEKCYCHNWSQDPFTNGAYSYVKKGGLAAQTELAKPLDNTLFFAGEMLPPSGCCGTVDSAIASGFHAAKQIISTLPS